METSFERNGLKQSKFQLTGLSRPHSATCTYGKEQDFFWPDVKLSQDRFDALWQFCENNWQEKKFAIIEYSIINDDGCPIDGKLVDITLE